MKQSFNVVDIFAGPGGLAEGFATLRQEGDTPFQIALSVEKEESAHRTLTLRHFLRHFPDGFPTAYYQFLEGIISEDQLRDQHEPEWRAAKAASLRRELGRPGVQAELDPCLDRIRDESAGNAILVGGPPCQAYSLVGRARNRGVANYVARDDHRHFLYKEYIRILDRLRPAAFVMENVKGILSSTVDGTRIFDLVLEDLQQASGVPDSYVLVPLSGSFTPDHPSGRDFLIRSEDHGVPQCRHRVIVVGLRKDVAAGAAAKLARWKGLPKFTPTPVVADVLEGMPPLRSGLSRSFDESEAWRMAAKRALRVAAQHVGLVHAEHSAAVADELLGAALELTFAEIPPRKSREPATANHSGLAEWIVDPLLRSLPNHETRGHMESDLARYAFVAAFGKVVGRSPKADEFPAGLAPDHRSWTTGKFADRFRVQLRNQPSSTITSHIAKDGHYFIHPDLIQCRSLTVREAARLQTFPDNYVFLGNRTEQFTQVGNAVPPLLANQIARTVLDLVQGNIDPVLEEPEAFGVVA